MTIPIKVDNKELSFKELAISKIENERKSFGGGQKEKAVHSYVANVIRNFCEQSEEFAETVAKTKRTLSDCCKDIMSGCGSYISDIEVYRRATKFYFPNSDVEGQLVIHITGDVPDNEYLQQEAKEPAPIPVQDKKPKKKVTESKKANNTKNADNTIQLSLF